MAKRFQRRANLLAEKGMLFHDPGFFSIQRSGLGENGLRDSNFPDVVDQSAYFQCVEIVLAQPETLSKTHRIVGDPCAMPSLKRITSFDGLRKGKDNGLRLFVDIGLKLEQGLNAIDRFPGSGS